LKDNHPTLIDEYINEEILFDKEFPRRLGVDVKGDLKNIMICYSSDKVLNYDNRTQTEKEFIENTFVFSSLRNNKQIHQGNRVLYNNNYIYSDKKIDVSYFNYSDGLVFSYNPEVLKRLIDLQVKDSEYYLNFSDDCYIYVEGDFYSDYLSLIKDVDKNVIKNLRSETDKIDRFSFEIGKDGNTKMMLFLGNENDSKNMMNILNGVVALLKLKSFGDKKLYKQIESIKIERKEKDILIILNMNKENEKEFIKSIVDFFKTEKKKD